MFFKGQKLFMKNIKYFIIFISTILILQAAIAFGAEPKSVYEQYYLTKIKDTQIGYSLLSQKEQQEEDKKLIITNRHTELKFKRLGFTIKMIQDIEYTEDDAGNPISFTANVESQGENINIQGKFITPQKMQVTSIVNGITKTEEITSDKPILFPYASQKLFRDQGQYEVSYSSIDPSNGVKILNINAKKIGPEALADDGLQETYTKYKVSTDILPGIDTYEWYDSNGKSVKETTSLLGMEQIAVTRDKVADQISDFDMFYQGIIPVETHITDPFNLDNATYKIDTKSESPQDIFVSDDRQKIIQTKGTTVYLKVKNETSTTEKSIYPVDNKEYSEYLRSGPFIIPDDPQIISQSKAIIGDEKDAYVIVKTMQFLGLAITFDMILYKRHRE